MRSLIAFFLLCSCTSVRQEYHNPLIAEILSPRVGYKTLTNQVINCDKNKVCKPDVIEYDLNDIKVREELKVLNFRCNIGGKTYFICHDGPGFCRRDYDIVQKFLGIVVKRTPVFDDPIDINKQYQFLLDAKARCSAHSLGEK